MRSERQHHVGGSDVYVGVVGPGEDAPDAAIEAAERVGRLVAARGWITICGGRDAGVMTAAARGASAMGGVVIGVLPGDDRSTAAPDLTIALPTGLGEARNAVIVTAADAVIACGINPGTTSEIALALKAKKPTALVGVDAVTSAFFASLSDDGSLHHATNPDDAVVWVAARLARTSKTDAT